MAYKLIVSPRTQQEIEDAIDYYSLYSVDAPKHFKSSLLDAYETLYFNPFFRIIYRNIRALKIKRFPYSIYFIVDEKHKIVKILSCFHNKRNPRNRP
jgi:toxin ParE1/3/4